MNTPNTTQKPLYRQAVFIVTYRKTKSGNLEYIILKRRHHWRGWEFPKGGVEKNENLFATAKRECFEETGLHPKNIKQFNIEGKYKYSHIFRDRPRFIGQTYTLFSAEVGSGRIVYDRKEHSGFRWLPFFKAIRRLTFHDQKRCLVIVNKWLINKNLIR
jgi:DNA polymerase